jgi:hypothetical protein
MLSGKPFYESYDPRILFVDDVGTAAWLAILQSRAGSRLRITTIGHSRQGREIHGIRINGGSRQVSITAGAQADEPAGPISAMNLASWLCETGELQDRLLEKFSFSICPQVNPDGAASNQKWFRDPPDALVYLQNVIRELPQDDVEFGYPGRGMEALRPENAAVAAYLRTAAPFVFHASLHSMGFSSGAWFLVGAGQLALRPALAESLARLASLSGFAPNDIQRNGEKGFTRIAPGFCTTPSSDKMREYFQEKGDAPTASWFRLNSMEFVQSLGGDPLLMVSEIPVFALQNTWTNEPRDYFAPEWSSATPAPVPGTTPYEIFRTELRGLTASNAGKDKLEALLTRYKVTPVPFSIQVKLQSQMVFEGLCYCEL